MKTLFIILKATTGVTLISPTALSITQDFNNQNFGNSDTAWDKVVTAGQNFMDTNLLNKGKLPLSENFDNFKKISSPGLIENDDAEKTEDVNGAPYVRFGGGLFLDNSNYSPESKQNPELQNNVFGTHEYVSTYPGVYDGDPFWNNKDIDQDVHAPVVNETGNLSNFKDTFDFSKTKVKTDPNDKIVNENDLNLTPDGTKIKAFFTQIFQIELYDWYWGTGPYASGWGAHYPDKILNNHNSGVADKADKDIVDAGITDSPKLNLSTSYNEMVSKKVSDPWYAKLGTGAFSESVGKVFDKLVKGIPGIGDLFDLTLDYLMPDDYTKYESVQQLFNYYSVALDQRFWSAFFNTELGLPGGDTGLINQYEQKFHKQPSNINLQNFDIYAPFSGLNITSNFHYDYEGPEPVPGSHSTSNSNINLNNLGINLGADIQLSNNSPDVEDSLTRMQNEFKKDSPLLEAKSTLKPPYKVAWDDNRYNNKDIDSQIGYTDHSLRNIIGDLTFEGDLSAPKEKFASTVHRLEVYYKGIDQGFPIYVSVENI